MPCPSDALASEAPVLHGASERLRRHLGSESTTQFWTCSGGDARQKLNITSSRIRRCPHPPPTPPHAFIRRQWLQLAYSIWHFRRGRAGLGDRPCDSRVRGSPIKLDDDVVTWRVARGHKTYNNRQALRLATLPMTWRLPPQCEFATRGAGMACGGTPVQQAGRATQAGHHMYVSSVWVRERV